MKPRNRNESRWIEWGRDVRRGGASRVTRRFTRRKYNSATRKTDSMEIKEQLSE